MIRILDEDGSWQVWWDLVGKCDGICIGDGGSKEAALREAHAELMTKAQQIEKMIECESPPSKNPSPAK